MFKYTNTNKCFISILTFPFQLAIIGSQAYLNKYKTEVDMCMNEQYGHPSGDRCGPVPDGSAGHLGRTAPGVVLQLRQRGV